MATGTPIIPAAAKARTLAHMNKDHRTDIAHMLMHFNGLSAAATGPDPELVDMDLASLTVRCSSSGGTAHIIAIDPPMANWDDRRQRLIDMTLAARKALGVVSADGAEEHGSSSSRGSTGVNTFIPPQGFDIVVFAGVIFYYANFALVRAGLFRRGTLGWNVLDAVVGRSGRLFGVWSGDGEAVAAYCWLVNRIAPLVFLIHIVEAVIMDVTKLQRHGVARGSAAWWKWIGCALCEGVTSFQRFDRMVADELRKAKKA
ncbi:hypothetical protein B0H63DRAFT_160368 [Podospora didyma]|uniref:DUF2470 domain-containing protein n=1 Tax=Podospora didyma TaxID=330526 RepID=A0AAE0NTW2_9PEZI|nr:hypothetical protein B0H63DRAFT_160368 [Podospora didyma]